MYVYYINVIWLPRISYASEVVAGLRRNDALPLSRALSLDLVGALKCRLDIRHVVHAHRAARDTITVMGSQIINNVCTYTKKYERTKM